MNKIFTDMKKTIKWILAVLLAVGIVAVFVHLWSKSRPKDKQYEVATVEVGAIRRTTIVTGAIEPRNEVEIKPLISGTIAELYVEAGQTLRMGDPIAKLRVITQAQSLSSAESAVRTARANMENAREVYLRDSVLMLQGVVAREEYDRNRLSYINSLESLRNAEDQLNIVRTGVAKSGDNAGSNTIVRATISGTVLDVPVKVGNTVQELGNFSAGTTIATMADMTDLLFVGKIDETEVGLLREGMTMDLQIGALGDQRFSARLEYISPKGTSNNGAMMFQIKGAATIPDSVVIRSGYSANAEIILEERKDVCTLSEECIVMHEGKTAVCLLTDTATYAVDTVEVTTGLSDGMHIEIMSGLKAGDKVRGNEKLTM